MYIPVSIIFKMCLIFKMKMLNHDKASRALAKTRKEMKCQK